MNVKNRKEKGTDFSEKIIDLVCGLRATNNIVWSIVWSHVTKQGVTLRATQRFCFSCYLNALGI